MSNFYPVSSLIGGGSGALDALVHTNADGFGTPLATGDIAIVGSSASPKFYRYDSTDTTPENSPLVIEPDSGGGAWTAVNDGNTAKVNLIQNSEFLCWSQGTPYALSTPYTDLFAADVDGWTASGGTASHHASGHLQFAAGAQWNYVYYDVSGLTVGKLYRLSKLCKVYCALSSKDVWVGLMTTAGAWHHYRVVTTVGASWVYPDEDIYFKAEETSIRISFQAATDTTVFLVDDVYFEEVVPAIASGTNQAPDRWVKSGTTITQLRRERGADYGINGMYCMVATPSSTANERVDYPRTAGAYGESFDEHWLQTVRGRRMCWAGWIIADVANQVCLSITDSGDVYKSAYHSGSGEPEWLEVTHQVSAACTEMYASLLLESTDTDPVVWSQPMLVMGDFIGEGNYQPIRCEYIYLTAQILGVNVQEDEASGATIIYNIEEVTEGRIAASVRLAHLRSTLRLATTGFHAYGLYNGGPYYCFACSEVGNITLNDAGWCPISLRGFYYSYSNATCSIHHTTVLGVMTN